MVLNDYEEKRTFARMQVKTPVDFSLSSNPGKRYHGQSHDLSATGLMMTTALALQVGDEIDLIMSTKNSRLPPFSAHGIVRRVDKQGTEFSVSVELTETH